MELADEMPEILDSDTSLLLGLLTSNVFSGCHSDHQTVITMQII